MSPLYFYIPEHRLVAPVYRVTTEGPVVVVQCPSSSQKRKVSAGSLITQALARMLVQQRQAKEVPLAEIKEDT